MSVWNPDNIRDVAESIGISALSNEVVDGLSRDVEYRVSQVLEEALKFMRHGKRTVLSTQDISQALRVLDVEPLYGYESRRPLRFGEASMGPGQPLFYVEDEEVDFEKLINAPLPKVPREISFTAHWLAVEGVQPSIPQNPTAADARGQELVPKGPGANTNLAAINGNDHVTVKPLVKHILSKELQLYFERICTAVIDDNNEEYRIAALASLRSDPGLHQLVPYFVQYIAEKVTHNLKNIFILTQMMHLTSAMLDNQSLCVDPYVASIVPPVLTCLLGRRLGESSASLSHFALRDLAASLLNTITKKYAKSSHTLKPRLVRTCLKHFLDPNKPLSVHYGAIIGLRAIGGAETVRVLLLPNLKPYESIMKDEMNGSEYKKTVAELVLNAILTSLQSLVGERTQMANGDAGAGGVELKAKVADKIGALVGSRIFDLGKIALAHAVVEDAFQPNGI